MARLMDNKHAISLAAKYLRRRLQDTGTDWEEISTTIGKTGLSEVSLALIAGNVERLKEGMLVKLKKLE